MGTKLSVSAAVTLLFWGVSAWSSSAHACKIKPAPDEFIVDSAPVADPAGPPALTLVGVDLQRSEHAPPGDGDCKEVGFLTIKLAPANGSSWPANVGVGLTLVSGTMPRAFPIPSYPLQTNDGTLRFAGGDDPSQDIDFTLRALALNRVGTSSPPIKIHIVGGARGSSGCALVRGPMRFGAVPVTLALLLLVFARPRRSR